MPAWAVTLPPELVLLPAPPLALPPLLTLPPSATSRGAPEVPEQAVTPVKNEIANKQVEKRILHR
jgi:hypothetical protein